MTDWARLDRLARRATYHWRLHRLLPDLTQEALLIGWMHQTDDNPILFRRMKFGVIDAARRELGRAGSGRSEELLFINQDDWAELPVVDPTDPTLELGLQGRHAVIARMLADGHTKTAVADRLGVHPSRVSQLIAELRTAAA